VCPAYRNAACGECANKTRCLGCCRAKAVDENGAPDPMGRDRNACRFFLSGYYDRARKVLESLGFGA